MKGTKARHLLLRRAGPWLAIALAPMLSGCLGAAVIPLMASGPLLGRPHGHAATSKPKAAKKAPAVAKANANAASTPQTNGREIELTSLKELPAPAATPAPKGPWEKFFSFALASPQAIDTPSEGRSVLLVANPPLVKPVRRDCPAQVPAVVIDLDPGMTPFDPAKLSPAPTDVAAGLAKLRHAGIVVMWISQLPDARAADVREGLRASGLDPAGGDRLLLIRGPDDRKQLLRADANAEACIIAMAGGARDDFDELFDYLRHPEEAVGLDAMLDKGWFIVPPLETPPGPAN
jgi:hypothetical protein